MVNSSAYSPLDGLLDLACRDGVDIRPTLLRVLTDLYIQKPAHTADEETQYVELAVGLIDSVDAATRSVVAARLSAYPSAPAAVLLKLLSACENFDRHPEVAALSAALEGCTPQHLRPSSPDQVRDRLFEARAPRSALAPQDDGNESTGQSAVKSRPVPASIRPAAPSAAAAIAAKQDLIELFFSASAEERRLILTNLDVTTEQPARVATSPADVIRRLESAALQRNAAEFGRILESGVGIAKNLAERIAYDSSGEAIVVAAKAIGMKADVLQRILLFLNPAIGHSVRRVFDLAQLYDEISPAAAARMLTIWRSTNTRPPPTHVPQYVDDQPTNARTTAMGTRYARPGAAQPLPHRAGGNGRT
jgi:hypothetical protein